MMMLELVFFMYLGIYAWGALTPPSCTLISHFLACNPPDQMSFVVAKTLCPREIAIVLSEPAMAQGRFLLSSSVCIDALIPLIPLYKGYSDSCLINLIPWLLAPTQIQGRNTTPGYWSMHEHFA